jgi:hypothetical protein
MFLLSNSNKNNTFYLRRNNVRFNCEKLVNLSQKHAFIITILMACPRHYVYNNLCATIFITIIIIIITNIIFRFSSKCYHKLIKMKKKKKKKKKKENLCVDLCSFVIHSFFIIKLTNFNVLGGSLVVKLTVQFEVGNFIHFSAIASFKFDRFLLSKTLVAAVSLFINEFYDLI